MGKCSSKTPGEPTLSFTREQFELEWFSGTGKGGQHRNKHQNCCRITHLPTGLRAVGQSHRERVRNRHEAFNALAERLIDHLELRPRRPRRDTSEVVRTYHGERNQVIDHRNGRTDSFDWVIGKGRADALIGPQQTD